MYCLLAKLRPKLEEHKALACLSGKELNRENQTGRIKQGELNRENQTGRIKQGELNRLGIILHTKLTKKALIHGQLASLESKKLLRKV